jgi:CheY-like chemotaxis protein
MQSETHCLRILVVDDNVHTAQNLTLLVGIWGYEARAALDGYEALAEASEFRPDVILCDLSMPGLDGYHVAKSLRHYARHAGTLLVAVTGHGDKEHRHKAAYSGFHAHFEKPVEADDLHLLLEAHAADLQIPAIQRARTSIEAWWQDVEKRSSNEGDWNVRRRWRLSRN